MLFSGSLAFQKLLICAYFAYISKVMTTFMFPGARFGGEHTNVMYIFTHHSIDLIKYVFLHIISQVIRLKHL